MSRPLSNKADKRVRLQPATIRAYMRAAIDAEERGEVFPDTLSDALDAALQEWLHKNHPAAPPPKNPSYRSFAHGPTS